MLVERAEAVAHAEAFQPISNRRESVPAGRGALRSALAGGLRRLSSAGRRVREWYAPVGSTLRRGDEGRAERARMRPRPSSVTCVRLGLAALPLLLLLAGCGPKREVPWTSVASLPGEASGMRGDSVKLPGGQVVELERRDGVRWGRIPVKREIWQTTEFPGVVRAPAPLLGLGRPAYRLDIEGKTCRQVPPLAEGTSRETSVPPGTFGFWRDWIYLGIAPGELPPEEATLRVRLQPEDEDALGFETFHGRRFSGRGLVVWPGRRVERAVQLPAGACLRFATVAEPASAVAPPGEVLFRVLVDGDVVLEHTQAFSSEGSFTWHRVAVPDRGESRLTFEVRGPFAYTAFLDPVLGPAEIPAFEARPRPSIVLFLADSFRADNLAAFGGSEGLTPELDRFAARSLRFTHGRSTGTSPLTALASLLTGLYPRQISSEAAGVALAREAETLAEVFTRAGYRTGAITDSGVISQRFGLDQGFAWFDERELGLASTLSRARAFLDADDGRPVFLLIQTERASAPYRAEDRSEAEGGLEPYRRLFDDLRARGGPKAALRDDAAHARSVARELEALYRQGVHDLDRAFGEFWRDLSSRGFPDTGTLVFAGVHGEAFYEHGQLLHGGDVFEEQIRVPILLHGPDIPPRLVDLGASLIDLPPTLTALARVGGLPYWQGTDLARLDHERTLFAFECAREESSVAILRGAHKLLALETPAGDRPVVPWQAFDLFRDPGERHDLLASQGWPEELLLEAEPMADALLVPLVLAEPPSPDAERIEPAPSAPRTEPPPGGEPSLDPVPR